MCFSRNQQRVLAVVFLGYGAWVGVALARHACIQPVVLPREHTAQEERALYLAAAINVNVADQQELQLLPGIGPVIALRIIAYREDHGPFRSADALQAIHGIGPKTIQKIRPYLTYE